MTKLTSTSTRNFMMVAFAAWRSLGQETTINEAESSVGVLDASTPFMANHLKLTERLVFALGRSAWVRSRAKQQIGVMTELLRVCKKHFTTN